MNIKSTLIGLALLVAGVIHAQVPPMPEVHAVWTQPPTTNTPISVKLMWEPSPDSGIALYRLYWGTNSGDYERTLSVTNTTQGEWKVVATNLFLGATNFFVVTASDTNGVESLPSNEVSTFVPTERPKPASNLRTAMIFEPVFEVSSDGTTWTEQVGDQFVVANIGKMTLVRLKELRFKGVGQVNE